MGLEGGYVVGWEPGRICGGIMGGEGRYVVGGMGAWEDMWSGGMGGYLVESEDCPLFELLKYV